MTTKPTAPRIYTHTYKGRKVEISRFPVATAYARNGNAHNPTVYYWWRIVIDGIERSRWHSKAEAIDLSHDIIDGGEA